MENERRKYWFGEAILAIIAAALVANAIRTGRLVPTEAEVNAALSHANPDEIEKYIEQMPVLPGAESLYQTLNDLTNGELGDFLGDDTQPTGAWQTATPYEP